MIQLQMLKDVRLKELRQWTTVEEGMEIIQWKGYDYLQEVSEEDKEDLVHFMMLLNQVTKKRFNHCEGSVFHKAVTVYLQFYHEGNMKMLDDLRAVVRSFNTVPFNQLYYDKEDTLQIVPVYPKAGIREYIEKYPAKKEFFQHMEDEHAAVIYFHSIVETVREQDLPLSMLLYTTYNLKYATDVFETLKNTVS